MLDFLIHQIFAEKSFGGWQRAFPFHAPTLSVLRSPPRERKISI